MGAIHSLGKRLWRWVSPANKLAKHHKDKGLMLGQVRSTQNDTCTKAQELLHTQHTVEVRAGLPLTLTQKKDIQLIKKSSIWACIARWFALLGYQPADHIWLFSLDSHNRSMLYKMATKPRPSPSTSSDEWLLIWLWFHDRYWHLPDILRFHTEEIFFHYKD